MRSDFGVFKPQAIIRAGLLLFTAVVAAGFRNEFVQGIPPFGLHIGPEVLTSMITKVLQDKALRYNNESAVIKPMYNEPLTKDNMDIGFGDQYLIILSRYLAEAEAMEGKLVIEQPFLMGKVLKTVIDQGGFIDGSITATLETVRNQELKLSLDFHCRSKSEFDCEKFSNVTRAVFGRNNSESFFDKVSSEKTFEGLFIDLLPSLQAYVELTFDGLTIQHKDGPMPRRVYGKGVGLVVKQSEANLGTKRNYVFNSPQAAPVLLCAGINIRRFAVEPLDDDVLQLRGILAPNDLNIDFYCDNLEEEMKEIDPRTLDLLEEKEVASDLQFGSPNMVHTWISRLRSLDFHEYWCKRNHPSHFQRKCQRSLFQLQGTSPPPGTTAHKQNKRIYGQYGEFSTEFNDYVSYYMTIIVIFAIFLYAGEFTMSTTFVLRCCQAGLVYLYYLRINYMPLDKFGDRFINDLNTVARAWEDGQADRMLPPLKFWELSFYYSFWNTRAESVILYMGGLLHLATLSVLASTAKSYFSGREWEPKKAQLVTILLAANPYLTYRVWDMDGDLLFILVVSISILAAARNETKTAAAYIGAALAYNFEGGFRLVVLFVAVVGVKKPGDLLPSVLAIAATWTGLLVSSIVALGGSAVGPRISEVTQTCIGGCFEGQSESGILGFISLKIRSSQQFAVGLGCLFVVVNFYWLFVKEKILRKIIPNMKKLQRIKGLKPITFSQRERRQIIRVLWVGFFINCTFLHSEARVADWAAFALLLVATMTNVPLLAYYIGWHVDLTRSPDAFTVMLLVSLYFLIVNPSWTQRLVDKATQPSVDYFNKLSGMRIVPRKKKAEDEDEASSSGEEQEQPVEAKPLKRKFKPSSS